MRGREHDSALPQARRALETLLQCRLPAGLVLMPMSSEVRVGAAELAAAVKTPEMAVQVYTAARRIITPNTVEERVFLAHLSAALGLEPRVVAEIDAMASGALRA